MTCPWALPSCKVAEQKGQPLSGSLPVLKEDHGAQGGLGVILGGTGSPWGSSGTGLLANRGCKPGALARRRERRAPEDDEASGGTHQTVPMSSPTIHRQGSPQLSPRCPAWGPLLIRPPGHLELPEPQLGPASLQSGFMEDVGPGVR